MYHIIENVDVNDSKFGKIYKFLVIITFKLGIVVSKTGFRKIKNIYTYNVKTIYYTWTILKNYKYR